MPDPKPSDPVILKILNGAQAGAEVALQDGTYAVGSGSQDDVQLIDVSLKPSHGRLRLRDGSIEIMADAGPLRTAAGVVLGPSSEWQAIEPLDVVMAGTMKFALGPASARWATISDDDPAAAGPGRAEAAPLRLMSLRALRLSAVPALGLALLGLFAAWILLGAPTRLALGRHASGTPLEQTRAALDPFPFGRDIEAHQEVDGTVYVNGYVETPVERRALANALEATGVQQRVRLWVLDSLRSEVAALLQTQKAEVGFDLSPKGVLTLNGTILSEETARHLVDRVKDQVLGLGAVESRIRTAPTLLADVRRLVEASQLQPWLLLRLDGTLIEVDGALPLDKVDPWVGFLQSYAKTFAKDIGLRSFVQLQAPGGRTLPAPRNAISIGGPASGGGDLALDIDKLKRGAFDLGDVFVDGAKGGEAPPAPEASTKPGGGGPGSKSAAGDGPQGAGGPGAAGQDTAGLGAGGIDAAGGGRVEKAALGVQILAGPGAEGAAGKAGAPGGQPRTDTWGPDASQGGRVEAAAASPLAPNGAAPGADEAAGRDLTRVARSLLERWRDGTLGTDSDAVATKDALDTLRLDEGGQPRSLGTKLPDWYIPLFSPAAPVRNETTCWSETRLRPGNLSPALFWLDLLSATDSRSLSTFSPGEQILLLEVALNPTQVQDCAKRSPAARSAVSHSLYLREIRRNPGFIRFLVRDLPPAKIDVSGVDFSRDRFVLTRAGLRMHEGSAPDRGSRLALVGELGLVVQQKTGLSSLVFDPDMTWRITP